MARITKHEQISKGCLRAELEGRRYPRWRKILTFDQLMSTPHPPVKGRQARNPAKRK